LLFCARAHAFIFDMNLFYYSDTLAPTAGTTTYSVTNYDVRLGWNVDSKERFYLGWNYSGTSLALSQTAGSTAYTSSEMGPSFLWALGKDHEWIISFAYNISSQATYTPPGGTPETWKGPTLSGYFGYNIALSPNMYMGPTITYHSATFNEKIVNNTTY